MKLKKIELKRVSKKNYIQYRLAGGAFIIRDVSASGGPSTGLGLTSVERSSLSKSTFKTGAILRMTAINKFKLKNV